MKLLVKAQGLGSPAYFGRLVRTLRVRLGHSQAIFAEKLGMTDSVLSRIEQGEHDLPGRAELLLWGGLLEIADDDLDDLLIAAGYVPETGFETSISNEDYRVVAGALREVVGRTEPQGYTEMLRRRLQLLWGRVRS